MAPGPLVKWAAFAVASLGLLYLSRLALRDPRSHGFYRFFAWECILGLFVLNVEAWFRNPLTATQLISWGLLAVSGFLALHAVSLLRREGRAGRTRPAGSLFNFERTTNLVTSGIYRYIRHPLYSSLLFLAWGIYLKAPGWLGGLLALAASGLLLATAMADERESLQFFGPSYRTYMERTKRFLPFLF